MLMTSMSAYRALRLLRRLNEASESVIALVPDQSGPEAGVYKYYWSVLRLPGLRYDQAVIASDSDPEVAVREAAEILCVDLMGGQ